MFRDWTDWDQFMLQYDHILNVQTNSDMVLRIIKSVVNQSAAKNNVIGCSLLQTQITLGRN